MHLDPTAHDAPATLAEWVVWTSSRRDRICQNQILTHLRKMILPIRRPLPKVGMRVSGHQLLTKVAGPEVMKQERRRRARAGKVPADPTMGPRNETLTR